MCVAAEFRKILSFKGIPVAVEQSVPLLFRQQRQEFAEVEKQIASLEEEKASIEEALCTGTLAANELAEKSIRLSALNEELDEKTMRWLELSEIPD